VVSVKGTRYSRRSKRRGTVPNVALAVRPTANPANAAKVVKKGIAVRAVSKCT
tara:strand:+ start:2376 stop:2534 length:159 start_codon:yes stop_codon:yes gene_type:complete